MIRELSWNGPDLTGAGGTCEGKMPIAIGADCAAVWQPFSKKSIDLGIPPRFAVQIAYLDLRKQMGPPEADALIARDGREWLIK